MSDNTDGIPLEMLRKIVESFHSIEINLDRDDYINGGMLTLDFYEVLRDDIKGIREVTFIGKNIL